MPQAIPIVATIAGSLVSSLLTKSSSSSSSSTDKIAQQQLALQQQQMDIQLEQTRAEQARADESIRLQQQTDAARAARAEASYLTEGGGAEGDLSILGKRSLLGG